MEEPSQLRDVLRVIRQDWEANGSDWTKPGFRALVMYRIGRWELALARRSIVSRIQRRLLGFLYTRLHRFVRNVYGIELHKTASVGRRVFIAHHGGIVIHDFATIGDECLIRHNVTLGSAGRAVSREEAPRLGDRVQLGAGSVILGRVRVGDDARIGANVVVYTDVPAGASLVTNAPRTLVAPKAGKPPSKD